MKCRMRDNISQDYVVEQIQYDNSYSYHSHGAGKLQSNNMTDVLFSLLQFKDPMTIETTCYEIMRHS